MTYQQRYRALHRKKVRAWGKARYARNPKYFIKFNLRRRMRLRKEIREKLGGKCVICGKTSSNLEAHEIHGRKHSTSEYWILKHLEDFKLVCKTCHMVISTIAKRPKDEQAKIWALIELINQEKIETQK